MPELQTDIQRIEQLDSDVLDTTQELQNFQGSIDGLSDEKKAEMLSENAQMLSDIEQTIKTCRDECDRLEKENKAENAEKLNQLKANLAKLEQIYNQVNGKLLAQTNAALNQLSNDTIASQNQSEQSQEVPEQKGPEEKGLKKWWHGLNDGTKKGIRVGGGILAGVGIISLFKRRKKKKGSSRNSGEKKSFWERPIGKVVKWTGIGTGIYYVAHGLATKKWGLKDFFDWDRDTPINRVEHVYDNYRELMEKDPEKYNEYEKIGTNINTMYDKIWDTERNYFGDDSQIVMGEIGNNVEESRLKKAEGYEHVEAKGLVTYSLDNFYGSVDEMLSHKGVNKYIRCKNIEEYKEKIRQFGDKWFDKIMVPYLASFASFASLGIVSSDSAGEKMHKYFQHLNENSEDHLAELDLFFRQYMKVLTYMADKKNAIALKEARKIISVNGYDGDTWPSNEDEQQEMLIEAINDKDWVKQNLEGTRYGAFMSSNILGASRILEEEDLDDSEPTEELQDIIDSADEQTEKIIGGSFDNNAFTIAEQKLSSGGTLGSSEISGLQKVADNVVEDLGDTTETSWMYDSFDYAFEALGLEEEAKQMLLKESGLDVCFKNMVGKIKELRTEVITHPTKDNVEKLKNVVGEYTSMKKELAVALYGMREAEENNKDFLDYVKQYGSALCTFFGHFVDSFKKCCHLEGGLSDVINVFLGLTVTGQGLMWGGKLLNKNWMTWVGGHVRNIGLGPITLTRMGLGRTKMGWAVKGRINTIGKYSPVHAQNVMERAILDGTLSPKQVRKIISKNEKMYKNIIQEAGGNEDVYRRVLGKMFEGKGLSDEEINLFAKYNGDIKGMIKYEKTAIVGDTGLKGGYKITDVSSFKKIYPELKTYDDTIKGIAEGPQKKYMQSLLKKCGTSGKLEEDLKFINKLGKDKALLEKLGKEDLKYLKKIKLSELKALDEAGDLGKFVRGEKHLGELLDGVPRLNRQAEKVTRRIFNERITSEISKIEKTYGKNMGVIQRNTIERLNSLKKVSHTDDEIKAFMTMMDNGFEPKYFSQIEKMFKLEYQSGRQIGKELKTLLMSGEYDEFATLLKQENKANAAIFRKAGIIVDEASDVSILRHLNKIFKVEGKVCKVEKPIIKAFVKVVAKVL